MTKVLQSQQATIAEDVTDRMMRYIDDEAIRYFLQNQEESKKNGTLSKFEYYKKLAANETDPVMQSCYEYSMLLPPEQALNLARDFYRKEFKSRTVSLDVYQDGSDEDLGDQGSALNTKFEYGNNLIDKGVFSTIAHAERRSPARNMELSDLFDKLFFEIGLSKPTKMVLIARLITGSSTGRQRVDRNATLDLSTIMHRLPDEYQIVQKKYKELLDAGVDESNITAKLILDGRRPTEDNPNKVERLLARWEITQANEELQDMIYKISEVGVDDLTALKKYLHVNESFEEIADDFNKEDIAEALDLNKLTQVITMMLSGKRVSKALAIHVLVNIVSINQKLNTPVTGSQLFKSGSVKSITRELLKLIESGKEINIRKVFNVIMAPVLFRNKRMKEITKKILNNRGETLAKRGA